jgi:hypothetical protein
MPVGDVGVSHGPKAYWKAVRAQSEKSVLAEAAVSCAKKAVAFSQRRLSSFVMLEAKGSVHQST